MITSRLVVKNMQYAQITKIHSEDYRRNLLKTVHLQRSTAGLLPITQAVSIDETGCPYINQVVHIPVPNYNQIFSHSCSRLEVMMDGATFASNILVESMMYNYIEELPSYEKLAHPVRHNSIYELTAVYNYLCLCPAPIPAGRIRLTEYLKKSIIRAVIHYEIVIRALLTINGHVDLVRGGDSQLIADYLRHAPDYICLMIAKIISRRVASGQEQPPLKDLFLENLAVIRAHPEYMRFYEPDSEFQQAIESIPETAERIVSVGLDNKQVPIIDIFCGRLSNYL